VKVTSLFYGMQRLDIRQPLPWFRTNVATKPWRSSSASARKEMSPKNAWHSRWISSYFFIVSSARSFARIGDEALQGFLECQRVLFAVDLPTRRRRCGASQLVRSSDCRTGTPSSQPCTQIGHPHPLKRREVNGTLEVHGSIKFAKSLKINIDCWWRRRESNPRPKSMSAKRLHA
jgi:hypothetical protein